MYSNRSPTEPGLTGLVNIGMPSLSMLPFGHPCPTTLHSGNTCFMNSGLQCLGAAAPLVDHFLRGTYKAEINTDNVLGTKGELSDAYHSVLEELWSSQTSVCDVRVAALSFAPSLSSSFAP